MPTRFIDSLGKISAGRQMAEAGVVLTKQLKPGTVPVKHLPFTSKPRSYDDVRPDLK